MERFMKYLISIFIAFFLSLPLIAENPNPVFIGNFTPEAKDVILSKFKSGEYNKLYNTLKDLPLPNLCDDSLWYMNDTISGCDWSNIPWYDSIAVVTLPNFPSCPIIVIYRVQICPNNPLMRQIDISSFVPQFPDCPGCDSLAEYLSFGDEFQQAAALQDIHQQLLFHISQYEAEQISDFPFCDSLGNYLPQYVFYKQPACKSTLSMTVILDSLPPIPFPIDIEIPCSRDIVCCKTTISFCKDSVGNVNPQITKELIGSNCIGDRPAEVDYEFIILYFNTKGRVLNYNPSRCINVCE